MDNEELKQQKRNLWFYPLGTVGRDMIYCLFTNFILLYILYTKQLTKAQLAAVTAIMVAARVFDAVNDPIMGNIIERTRTKWGKFKPWLLIGVLSTCVVVYLAFNTNLTGWSFIVFFGIIYFAYSITYTMHDISYWGMVPALSSDADTRNKFTARATRFAGIGGLTELAYMQLEGNGIAGIDIEVPFRYSHSCIETSDLNDVVETIKLTEHVIRKINKDTDLISR